MVFVYFNMGQVIAAFKCRDDISSYCLLHLVEVSAFRMFSVCFALVMATFICSENGSSLIRRKTDWSES